MQPRPHHVPLLIAVLIACFALAACSPSAMAGGVTGGALGLFVLGMLLAGTMTTQTGCDKNPIHVGPCLSIAPPEYFDDQGNYVGPPDRQEDMAQDMGTSSDQDADIAPPPVTPCLSIAPPEPDTHPCLSPVIPDDLLDEPEGSLHLPHIKQEREHSPEKERLALLEKLSERLPADVVARLHDDHTGKS